MSNTLLIKRSAVPGSVPTTANLALGELAVNTYDGRLFTKVDTGTPSIFELTQNQPITATGNVTGVSTNGVGNTTLDLTLSNTGVSSGTYGGSNGPITNVGVFTVDQYGRITSASNLAVSTSGLANGNANIAIFANSNIALSPGGTANVAVFATDGQYLTGLLSVSGNITGANIDTAGLITATGNVIAGNLNTGGLVSSTGNVIGGNLNTAGLVSATGNLIGGNVSTAGNVDSGNLNTGIVSASGNVIGGNVTTAGNVTGANINTGGLVSAVGNVIGGNVSTAGVVTATGNVIGGNVSTAGVVTATGNVIGGNLVTAGLASVTGNVISGNVETAIVSATGNVIGANVNTAGLVSATGNVVGGNLVTAGFANVTGNIIGGNVSTAGNVAANGVLTDNYYYANGQPVDFMQPAGANTQIQFNNNNDFGASANFTFDIASNALFVGGTANVTNSVTAGSVTATGNISGANLGITGNGNITGANVI